MNLGDQRQALLDDLSVESTDTFFTTAILNRFINRAIKAISNLKNWQQTQGSDTQALVMAGDETDEYWNYPENYKTDSIYRLEYNGESYKRLTWQEYLKHKLNHSSSTKRVYSDHKRQLFIHPRPTTNANLDIWGHEIPADLSDDADEHPFNDEQLLEEAIQQYALGLCYRKRGGSYRSEGKQLIKDAIALALESFNQQRNEQAGYRTEHAEMFEHTDFLPDGSGRPTRRGSFEQC
jgi:hypothetical protein